MEEEAALNSQSMKGSGGERTKILKDISLANCANIANIYIIYGILLIYSHSFMNVYIIYVVRM